MGLIGTGPVHARDEANLTHLLCGIALDPSARTGATPTCETCRQIVWRNAVKTACAEVDLGMMDAAKETMRQAIRRLGAPIPYLYKELSGVR
jgi:hypothetical protein